MKLWIARDRSGILRIYYNQPKVNKRTQEIISNGEYYEISINSFPEVTFENSPQQIELRLLRKLEKTHQD